LSLAHPATEADMLAIQLDARALFAARWRNLLLALIDEEAMNAAPLRREFRELVSTGAAEASPEAVGYRLVRTFRSNTLNAMWRSLVTGLLGEKAMVRRAGQFEAAGWRLVNERPSAVAPPGGGNWRDFLLGRLDATIDELLKDCASLASCEYGQMAPPEVRHPLSGALPLLPKLIDMPTRALAGDQHMPRVQSGSFGASERFAVSPGRESDGYLQLPGGPSGHPLSPFYRSGYEDWANGVPTPFLPGAAAHRLTLRP
jgi:penicillin amidase